MKTASMPAFTIHVDEKNKENACPVKGRAAASTRRPSGRQALATFTTLPSSRAFNHQDPRPATRPIAWAPYARAYTAPDVRGLAIRTREARAAAREAVRGDDAARAIVRAAAEAEEGLPVWAHAPELQGLDEVEIAAD